MTHTISEHFGWNLIKNDGVLVVWTERHLMNYNKTRPKTYGYINVYAHNEIKPCYCI